MKKNLKSLLFLLGVFSIGSSWSQNNSLNFDGANDYVQWGDPEQGVIPEYAVTPIVEPLVESDFTIEFWMKSDIAEWELTNGVLFAFNSYGNLGHASNRLIFGIGLTGRLYIHDGFNNGLSSEDWTGTTIVADGECHHIAFTHSFTERECLIYIDGELEGTFDDPDFILDKTDVFSFGQEWDNLDGAHDSETHGPSQYYYGDIDDIRIWTKIRFASEIHENQYTVFSPSEPDLLAYFKADQGTAGADNTTIDYLESSGLTPGLEGTLNGFDLSIDVSNFVRNPCQPCAAQWDESFYKIEEDIEYDVDTFWDDKYYVADGVTVTVSNGAVLDITNVDVVFGECAGIVVEYDSYVRINNSVLRPCSIDRTWKGISFLESDPVFANNNNVINESTFKNAKVALAFNKNRDGLISNNLFSNCNYGLKIQHNDNFSHAISGNRFVTEGFYPEYPSCPLDDDADNTTAYGISTSEAFFSQQISHNEFINGNGKDLPRVIGVSQFEGGSVCSSNTFTDMLHAFVINNANGYSAILNNNIEVNYPTADPIATNNISILIDGTNGPLIEVNNNRIVNNENQNMHYAAIGLRYSSAISVATNDIEGFDRGISALRVYNCQITENTITNSARVGIQFEQLATAIISPSYITCNVIKMKNFNASIGFLGRNMTRDNEISSNCIFDCATSMYLDGGGNLPLIRNNYLYNYNVAGIDVIGHNGNIGSSPSDPGMNTFWSNDNLAMDVQSSPNVVQIADNFGMFNISWPTVAITSANPYHSTASCGHQIFNSPSQGNLNIEYGCDNRLRLVNGLKENIAGFERAKDFQEELVKSENPYEFIKVVIGTLTILDEAGLDAIINSVELTENEEALLRYSFFQKKQNWNKAEFYLTMFAPENELEEDFRQLRLLNLKVLENDYSILTNADIDQIKVIAERSPFETNYAIHLLNNTGEHTDYVFEPLSVVPSIKAINVKRIEEGHSYLKVYPNPATSIVNVELIAAEEGDVIQLLGITGQIIGTYSVGLVAGKIQIDLSDLGQGVYYLVLSNEENGIKQKEKIVKMTN